MDKLQNKCLVVIGGTTGIGLSAAKAFIADGASVVAVGRNPESVRAAQEILGPKSRVFVGDATEADTSRIAIEKCCHEFGGFHGLYHVAGGSGRSHGDGPLHEITAEGWNYTIQLNLTSVFYSNQAAARQFLAHKSGGAILNLSSVLAYSPSPAFFGTHAYAAAKAAIIGLTRTAAAAYAKDNIRFNVLAPALVETPMAQRAVANPKIMEFIEHKQPLDGGRAGLPSDLDGAALYFMSEDSRFVTGQVLAIDGGWSVSDGS